MILCVNLLIQHTFELPRRRGSGCTGVCASEILVKSLVDFRQRNDTTLSEQVRSNVVWEL